MIAIQVDLRTHLGEKVSVAIEEPHHSLRRRIHVYAVVSPARRIVGDLNQACVSELLYRTCKPEQSVIHRRLEHEANGHSFRVRFDPQPYRPNPADPLQGLQAGARLRFAELVTGPDL